MPVNAAVDNQFTFVAGLSMKEKALYAAGLFDGEGSLYYKKPACSSIKKGRWKLTLTSTDFDIIDNYHAAILYKGKLNGPYFPANKKPYVVWSTVVQEDIYALCIMMYPYLCARRQAKIREFIEWFKLNTKGKPECL